MKADKQIVAMRGRDKFNPSLRGHSNENYEQRLEPNTTNCSNTLTSVQKDNLVLESMNTDLHENWVWEINGEKYLIRIRKLTPKECWRLMSFTDEDFSKTEEVMSNSSLYKQAGNSIVTEVLCAIFKEML